MPPIPEDVWLARAKGPAQTGKQNTMKKVVVTGMGIVSPLGCDLKVFTERLAAGFNGIGPITRFDASGDFPVNIAGEVRDFDINAFFDSSFNNDLFIN